jgi:hypothetical protein
MLVNEKLVRRLKNMSFYHERENIAEYVKRGVNAEYPMTKKILSFLPEQYRGLKNEDKYGPYDFKIGIPDLSGKSDRVLRVELEWTNHDSPLGTRCFIDNSFMWENTMRHYSIPIRKINNAKNNGWDLFVKFNVSMNAFYAFSRGFILEYGIPDRYSNVSQHIKPNNDGFYILSHPQYRDRMILDPEFGDIRFIKNDPKELAKFVEVFFKGKR